MSKELIAGYEKYIQDINVYASNENLVYAVSDIDTTKSTVDDKMFVGRVYRAVCKSLEAMNLWNSSIDLYSFENTEAKELKSIYADAGKSAATILSTAFDQFKLLVEEAKIPNSQKAATLEALGNTLRSYLGRSVETEYFNQAGKTENSRGLESMYPQAALASTDFERSTPSMEMFGSTMDQMVPDIRIAMTVALLKPHKGIWSRVMHRRNTNTNAISYQTFQDEFYDLNATQSMTATIRNSLATRHNVKDLMRRPDPIEMNLIRIEPLTSNDPSGTFLYDNGVLLFGVECNLWDLATIPDKLGYNRYNWTDLISEKINVETVHFKVKRTAFTPAAGGAELPELEETFSMKVISRPDSAFQQKLTTQSSAKLNVACEAKFALHEATTMADGNVSAIFAGINAASTYIMLNADITGKVHKQEGNVLCNANARYSVATQKGVAASPAVVELAQNLSVEFLGYSIDARYSEENLRKANMAVRSLTGVVTYDLPQPKGIIAEYSLFQNMQEHVLDTAQNLLTLGIDHRNIQMTLKTVTDLHDKQLQEIIDPNYRVNYQGDSSDRQYVSANKVNFIILMGELDLSQVTSVRFSDTFGDIKQYVTSYLTKIISNMHNYSLYTHQIDPGETPTYRVITSTPVVENILALPHIHAHMDRESGALYKARNVEDNIEYTLELPSGVKFECVTTSFATMQDKMIIMPFRPTHPESVLNFGHNWDGGNYAVNFTPNDDGEAHRRMYMAAREYMYLTCPIALILTVKGLNEKLPTLGDDVIEYLDKILNV